MSEMQKYVVYLATRSKDRIAIAVTAKSGQAAIDEVRAALSPDTVVGIYNGTVTPRNRLMKGSDARFIKFTERKADLVVTGELDPTAKAEPVSEIESPSTSLPGGGPLDASP